MSAILNSLQIYDEQLLRWLNQHHNWWLDQVMIASSDTWTWLPLYLLLLWWLWRTDRSQVWLHLLAVILLIVLADQASASLIKPWIGRQRPCHEPSLLEWLHLPAGCGGIYGFVSSHAANVFALATLWVCLWGGRQPLWHMLWLWAVWVSLSRVYLGKHYPSDILFGALLGGICGLVVYFSLYRWIKAWLLGLFKK